MFNVAQLQDLMPYAAYPDLSLTKCVYCQESETAAPLMGAAAAADGRLT